MYVQWNKYCTCVIGWFNWSSCYSNKQNNVFTYNEINIILVWLADSIGAVAIETRNNMCNEINIVLVWSADSIGAVAIVINNVCTYNEINIVLVSLADSIGVVAIVINKIMYVHTTK